MTEAQTAWLAGLLEGDGCFTQTSNRLGGRWPAVSLAMDDEDVVRRAHKLAGVGDVRAGQQRANGKRQWRWVVNRSHEAAEVMERVRPWMGNRRGARIDELLTAWNPKRAAYRRRG